MIRMKDDVRHNELLRVFDRGGAHFHKLGYHRRRIIMGHADRRTGLGLVTVSHNRPIYASGRGLIVFGGSSSVQREGMD